MSTTTAGTGGAAAREMPLIHRIFLAEQVQHLGRELADLGDLRIVDGEVGGRPPGCLEQRRHPCPVAGWVITL